MTEKSRYIDAIAAQKEIDIVGHERFLTDGDIYEIKLFLDEQPTADVAPVVHARWLISEYEYYDCSHCGNSYYTGNDSTREAKEKLKNGMCYNYCPHCGAIMDGKENEE